LTALAAAGTVQQCPLLLTLLEVCQLRCSATALRLCSERARRRSGARHSIFVVLVVVVVLLEACVVESMDALARECATTILIFIVIQVQRTII
jgi:hypothetical protein